MRHNSSYERGGATPAPNSNARSSATGLLGSALARRGAAAGEQPGPADEGAMAHVMGGLAGLGDDDLLRMQDLARRLQEAGLEQGSFDLLEDIELEKVRRLEPGKQQRRARGQGWLGRGGTAAGRHGRLGGWVLVVP